jgi:hypothetical protein
MAAAAALAAGCATKVYIGPTSGRGAEPQLAISLSAERAFAALDVAPYRGKRVAVEVYGLTERLERDSPEEAFVRGLLVERLLRGGAMVAASRDDADMLMAVTLRSAGVDVVRRDFPPVYHHTTFEGVTSAQVIGYVLRGKAATAIASIARCEGTAIYREIYLFYIVGPIPSGDAAAPRQGGS